jgi:hypothetical protein
LLKERLHHACEPSRPVCLRLLIEYHCAKDSLTAEPKWLSLGTYATYTKGQLQLVPNPWLLGPYTSPYEAQ